MNPTREYRRKKHLFELIEERRRLRGGLELILGSQPGRQHELANSFRKLGRVGRVYETIPFFSASLGMEEAQQLALYVHRDSCVRSCSRAFESSYGNILRSISSLDAASRFRSVPSPKQRGRGVFYSVDFEGLWNLQNIGAYEAQKISGGEDAEIAIIDTGIDYTHPDLAESFGEDKGYDFVRDSHDPMDRDGHGTHVAGTACSPNCGVSLDSRLYAIRVLDENGSGSEADIIAGIDYCIRKGYDVANMSLGSSNASRAFEAVCRKAYESGLVLVAAAGNDGYGPDYPAAFGESVIAVAAVDFENEHAEFSNVWDTNDISAPGVDIISCLLGGGYTSMDGTSMATPHVTGTVALAVSMFKREPDALMDYIEETAQQLEYDGGYDNSWVFGSGLVRADRLLARIANSAAIRSSQPRRR
jgi:subtilisin family serine protease